MPQFTLLDEYSRRARLLPAMIVTLPAVIAAAAWLPTLTVVPIATALFSWFGVGVFLSELSRDAGKRREAKLWAGWGGSPTVRRLRLRDASQNPETRDRWRSLVTDLAPGTPLLNSADEVADPARADNVIDICVARLRELTRDTSKFPLVFQENMAYGFRRNLWAMKRAAIALTLLAIAATLAAVALRPDVDTSIIIVSIICSAAMLTWWLLRIRPSWVREAAERYADQLLWSCEQIEVSKKESAAARTVGF